MRRFLLLILFTVVAFFYGRAQSGYALLKEDGGSLSVCNNVVINNGGGQSNVTSTYNLLGHYPLFAHSYSDFHIVRPELVFTASGGFRDAGGEEDDVVHEAVSVVVVDGEVHLVVEGLVDGEGHLVR